MKAAVAVRGRGTLLRVVVVVAAVEGDAPQGETVGRWMEKRRTELREVVAAERTGSSAAPCPATTCAARLSRAPTGTDPR